MATRSIHIKKVNIAKTAEVEAMLKLLDELDNGSGGDFGGFEDFGIIGFRMMEGRINSYRAQKIAKYLGKNISKSHLVKFSKDRETLSKKDLRDIIEKGEPNKITVNGFIDMNKESLLAYWQYSKGFYINSALLELDSSHI